MEDELKKDFKKYCVEKGVSMSEVIRELIGGVLIYHNSKRIDR